MSPAGNSHLPKLNNKQQEKMNIFLNFLLLTLFLATILEAKPIQELSESTGTQLATTEKLPNTKSRRKTKKLKKSRKTKEDKKLSRRKLRSWKKLKNSARKKVHKNSRKRSTRTQNRELRRQRRLYKKLPVYSSGRRFDRIAKEMRFIWSNYFKWLYILFENCQYSIKTFD